MPLTVSLGITDSVRVFAGPAFTIGTPALTTRDGNRR
jgi:hypothetical protein